MNIGRNSKIRMSFFLISALLLAPNFASAFAPNLTSNFVSNLSTNDILDTGVKSIFQVTEIFTKKLTSGYKNAFSGTSDVTTQTAAAWSDKVNAVLDSSYDFAIDKTANIFTRFFVEKTNQIASTTVKVIGSGSSALTASYFESAFKTLTTTSGSGTKPFATSGTTQVVNSGKNNSVNSLNSGGAANANEIKTTGVASRNQTGEDSTLYPLIKNILVRITSLENNPRIVNNVVNNYSSGSSSGGDISISAFYGISDSFSRALESFKNNTLPDVISSAISATLATDVTVGGNVNANGNITATAFYGDGSNLTGITSFSTSTTRSVFGAGTALSYDSSNGIFSLATSTLSTSDLSEGSNLYFTNTRADARADIRFAANLGVATSTIQAMSPSLSTSTVRSMFSSSATGLTFTSGTGDFSLTSGYSIPLAASTTEWATAYASTTNLTAFWSTPSTRISVGTGLSWSGNTLNSTGVTSIGGLTGSVATSSLGLVGGTGNSGTLARWTSSGLTSSLFMDNGSVAGINATSTSYTFNVRGSGSLNPFNIASSTNSSLFTVLANGNVGIGATTSSALLSVAGATTAKSSIRIISSSGINPSSPTSGDLWWNGTNLYFYNGSSNRDLISPFSIDSGNNIYSSNTSSSSPRTNTFAAGENAGYGATNAYDANFLGRYSGYQATGATNSNFFTEYAGYQASNAYSSNFLGASAGSLATNAAQSNFLGVNAGSSATNASDSNFLGANTGYGATYASSSNFFGPDAGNSAVNANNSNFFGYQSGYIASDAAQSNFIGYQSGYLASGANRSNFFGFNSGNGATNASYANFFGFYAGYGATGANDSTFIGTAAGNGATGAYYSNFIGRDAGNGATGAYYSNFMGPAAGTEATNAYQSNFIGAAAGLQASSAYNSNFIGSNAGFQATSAYYSNFMGESAGLQATYASQSNFFGNYAGGNATNASYSNFLGNNAGYQATNAENSNFFGRNAGSGATGAYYSNFIGRDAGQNATGAYFSNFVGNSAGLGATNATFSNFIGMYAGASATNVTQSTFIGRDSGYGATNADDSNFIGTSAGNGAANAANSVFIGLYAGAGDVVDNTTPGNWSIAIGPYSGTGGYSNSMAFGRGVINSSEQQANFGNVLYLSDIYNSDTQSSSPVSGKVGIGTTTPGQALSVVGNIEGTGSFSVLGNISAASSTFTNFTSGSIPFFSTGGVLSQNNSKLLWDNTNFSLKINGGGAFGGSNAPLSVAGSDGQGWGARIDGSIGTYGSVSVGSSLNSLYGYAGAISWESTGLVWNDASANADFRMEGDTDQNLFFLDASSDRIGIGTATPGATLEVNGGLMINKEGGYLSVDAGGVKETWYV